MEANEQPLAGLDVIAVPNRVACTPFAHDHVRARDQLFRHVFVVCEHAFPAVLFDGDPVERLEVVLDRGEELHVVPGDEQPQRPLTDRDVRWDGTIQVGPQPLEDRRIRIGLGRGQTGPRRARVPLVVVEGNAQGPVGFVERVGEQRVVVTEQRLVHRVPVQQDGDAGRSVLQNLRRKLKRPIHPSISVRQRDVAR